jgi:hypothetical protein
MGEHRQISGVPAGASVACAGGCTSHGIRTVPLTLTPETNSPVTFSPIGRSAHISCRAVKGTQAQVPSPAWSPGRRGRAPLAAAPLSLRVRRITQSRKPSQTRRILSHPKQRLGWGREGGFLSANRLRHSKRQSNSMKKSVANGCTRTNLLSQHLVSALPSLLWSLGKAREKNRVTSSVCFNSNSDLAVFNDSVGSISQSSVQLTPTF